jgi:Ser/Thr protein kinase RdoA (MazF antagonist)
LEQIIRERFNDKILAEARQRYDLAPEALTDLGGFESFIYAFDRDNGRYILRMGHSRRRSADMIRGEVDWLNYLAAGGAGVARAVESANRELVEMLPDGHGDYFVATAFVRAPGNHVTREQWQEEFWVEYGRFLGKIHALTKNYEPSQPQWRRPDWDDPIFQVMGWLPESEWKVRQKYDELMAYLATLPQDRESYGLVHQDAHRGNFFVDEAGKITLFDFDDCIYSWYAYDVAIVIFYAITNEPEPDELAKRFFKHFRRGYEQENRLDTRWYREIPHFLKQREIDLYGVIYRSFDVDNLTDSWVAWFMQGRKERIENDVPYVAVEDWEAKSR